MGTRLLHRLLAAGRDAARARRRRLAAATRPATAPLLAGAVADLARTTPEILAENALLRQQLLILRRQVKRPRCTPADRALLVLLASRLRTWRQPCSSSSRTRCWAGIASSSAGPGAGNLGAPSRRTARPSRPRRSP